MLLPKSPSRNLDTQIKMEFTVSIRLMTYNHSEFIQQAMNGIMMQQTNFKVEVVIGDDFSTDNTLELIKSYKNTQNITIKLLERSVGDAYWVKRQKFGRLYNFVNILENCKGKYIALLDGDDYWTDPLKLQKQVDFLEANDKFIGCCSNAIYECSDTSINGKQLYPATNTTYSIQHFIEFNKMITLSVMFRNIPLNIVRIFKRLKIGDWPLFCCLAEHGDFFYSNEVQGVYRIHQGGVYSSINNYNREINILDTYLHINTLLKRKYQNIIKQEVLHRFNHISYVLSYKEPTPYWGLRLRLISILGFTEMGKLVSFSLKRNKLYYLQLALRNKIKSLLIK